MTSYQQLRAHPVRFGSGLRVGRICNRAGLVTRNADDSREMSDTSQPKSPTECLAMLRAQLQDLYVLAETPTSDKLVDLASQMRAPNEPVTVTTFALGNAALRGGSLRRTCAPVSARPSSWQGCDRATERPSARLPFFIFCAGLVVVWLVSFPFWTDLELNTAWPISRPQPDSL